MLIRILLICSLFFYSSHDARSQWTLARETDGIKVYTGKIGTSKFKSIKVEASLPGTMNKLIKILTDAGSNKDWVYKTENSYIIKRITPNEVLSYTETSVPWPANNRDVPLRMQLIHDAKNNTLKVIAKGEPNAIPEKKGIVRIPFFNSWWDVKYDGKNRLNIVYFLEMDPGGSVPAWLVNMFVAKGPYETFSGLAKMLQR